MVFWKYKTQAPIFGILRYSTTKAEKRSLDWTLQLLSFK